MFRTFTDQLPGYLEHMDKKKQRMFRGAHPKRYQADIVSVASRRSKSNVGALSNAPRFRSINGGLDQMSSAGRSHVFRRSQMSNKAGGTGHLMPTRAAGLPRASHERQTLREFITENTMYEEVVDQINKKIALRNAIDRANDAISSAKRSSHMGGDDVS